MFPQAAATASPILSSDQSSSSNGSQMTSQMVFEEFERYPFSDDPEFKAGLPTVIKAIRGTKRSAAQIDEMISRAQWFYFTRLQGVSIPWEEYASYSRQTPRPSALSRTSSSSSSPGDKASGGGMIPADSPDVTEARKMMSADSDPTQSGMSFTMLARLISEGRAGDVEGVKQIPDELNPLPPSQSTMTARPKPWERQRVDPTPPPTSYSNSSQATPWFPTNPFHQYGHQMTPTADFVNHHEEERALSYVDYNPPQQSPYAPPDPKGPSWGQQDYTHMGDYQYAYSASQTGQNGFSDSQNRYDGSPSGSFANLAVTPDQGGPRSSSRNDHGEMLPPPLPHSAQNGANQWGTSQERYQ